MKLAQKTLLLFLFCFILSIPHPVEARAGGGSSMGSRGSHTYQSVPSHQAAPIQRSYTPPPAPRPQPTPSYAPAPGYAQPSHPFLSGIAGGFLGAGLAGMMFGHGGYGGYGGVGVAEYSPVGSFIGGLIQILLLIGVVWFILRIIRSRSPGMGSMMPMADTSFDAPAAMPWGETAQPIEAPLTVTPDDYRSFQELLGHIQQAWGNTDLTHLRQYLTPEMLQYFNEQLSANTSRGEVNRISDVVFVEGNLAEAWSEAALDYATVHMKWKAIDFMARLDRQPSDADYVASGDAVHPVDAQEIWTFARARNGGHWLLSAIQQVA